MYCSIQSGEAICIDQTGRCLYRYGKKPEERLNATIITLGFQAKSALPAKINMTQIGSLANSCG